MNVTAHHAVDGGINGAVAGQWWHPGKGTGANAHMEVTGTAGGSGMPGMQCAVITHLNVGGGESGFQQGGYPGNTCSAHGRTGLKGLTSTDSNTPPLT